MPIGNLKTWSFKDPMLVARVVNDPEFIQRGYVWGFDGSVHYCFLDPDRYALNIWEKEFWWRSLGWLFLNIIAAFLVSEGGPPAIIAALIAVPTAPLAFLGHYRRTAQAQPAAVETNGPQMEYPGALTTAGMVTAGLTGGALGLAGGMAAGFQAAVAAAAALNAAATAAGIAGIGATWSSTALVTIPGIGIAVSGPFLIALVGIGAGINAFAVTLFLAGLYSHPYDQVRSPAINDPGIGGKGTFHIGRTAQPIGTYIVGADPPPPGLTWVCGGMTPIILNGLSANLVGGAVTAIYNNLFLPPPGGWIPNDFVIWGLIALPAQPLPQPIGDSLPLSSDEEIPGFEGLPNPQQWSAGLIVVAGAAPWTHLYTRLLLMHGTAQAVATDGHLSPLLGSGSVLKMETNMFLDPIQKYGIDCLPE